MTTASRSATRRERRREATYAEIVAVSRQLLADGEELSLRAVANRMGLTAPALYRYVGSYQELVDLVAFEIDKAATAEFVAAAEAYPTDDPAARLIAASVGFRRWAHARPREFGLVFANPIADTACVRRELLTSATSGLYMNGLLLEVYRRYDLAVPPLEELDPALREAVLDPLIPIDASEVPAAERGVLWLFMRAWASLYGVVTLEVFGHMDPRVIESGAMFLDLVEQWIPRLGLGEESARLMAVTRAELNRPS